MIALIVGLMNSGKTLFLTYKLFEGYNRGYKVMSNYDLNFPHSQINRDYVIYLGENQILLEKTVLGLDEAWIYFDSRAIHSNTIATYFFNQSSKSDTRIYLSSQYVNQVDKRLRENCHKIYQCDRVVKIEGKYRKIDNEIRFLPKKYQDILYIEIEEYKRVNVMGLTTFVFTQTIYLKASDLFNLYDTKQRIIRHKANE